MPDPVPPDSLDLFDCDECPACGANIDTSGIEPLTEIGCPECGQIFRASEFIAGYRLLAAIGRGGMGVVFRALDPALNRPIALKLLRADKLSADALSELVEEAIVTASITHPNVVKVITAGTHGRRFYIAMELMEHATLDVVIRKQGALPEAQSLDLAIQVTEGLRAAAMHGLVHRDVKPGNILFTPSQTAKIADFGLAILQSSAGSKADAEIWGTPYYISPERLERQPEDLRSDIYSLGATLFHTMAGRPPFEAKDATAVAMKHLKGNAVSLQAFAPWISGRTAFVVNRMLQKDPAARYQDYEELLQHLHYARDELAAKGGLKPTVTKGPEKKQSGAIKGMLVGAGVLGACALVGGGFLVAGKKHDPKPRTAEAAAGAKTQGPTAISAVPRRAENGRKLLASGKAAEAATEFHALAADPGTPAPQLQWSMVLEGLSQLAAANLPGAQSAFRDLQQHPYHGEGPDDDGKLQDFFAETARVGASSEPVATDIIKVEDNRGPETLLYLIAGLQNWLLGNFNEANILFGDFDAAAVYSDMPWIDAFRDLSQIYLADFAEYKETERLASSAKNPDEMGAVLTRAKRNRGELRVLGKLGEKYDALIQQQATSLQSGAARPKAAAFCAGWQVDDAARLVSKISWDRPAERIERSALMQKIDWLRAFRRAIVADISSGSKPTLKLRKGSSTGAIASATEASLMTASGALIQWADLEPLSLLEYGKQLAGKPGQSPAASAESAWTTGVYAIEAGDKTAAASLLDKAIKARPGYAHFLPQLGIPNPAEDLCRGKPIKTNAVSQPNGGPEKAVDGLLTTMWKSKKDASPAWIRVDLGSERTISRWRVLHANVGDAVQAQNTADFSLQKSSDDVNWKEVDAVTGNTADVTAREVQPFTARYLRLTISKAASNDEWITRIIEWEAFSPAVVTAAKIPDSLFAAPGSFSLPEFTSLDIGPLEEPKGSTEYDLAAGRITMRCGGDDFWNRDDHGRFSGVAVSGDGSISACVASITEIGSEWTKGGLMYRDSLDPKSTAVLAAVTPRGTLFLQARTVAGEAVWGVGVHLSVTLPVWIKLGRTGNKFTAYYSQNGLEWKEFSSVDCNLKDRAYTGFAAASHWPGTQTEAVFDCVQLLADPALPAATAK